MFGPDNDFSVIFCSGSRSDFPNSDYFRTVRWSLRRINSRDDDSDNFSAPLALNQSNSTSGKDLFFVWIKIFKFQTFDYQWYSVIKPSVNREVSCRFKSWRFGRRSVSPGPRKSGVLCCQSAHTCDMQFRFGCLRFFII